MGGCRHFALKKLGLLMCRLCPPGSKLAYGAQEGVMKAPPGEKHLKNEERDSPTQGPPVRASRILPRLGKAQQALSPWGPWAETQSPEFSSCLGNRGISVEENSFLKALKGWIFPLTVSRP